MCGIIASISNKDVSSILYNGLIQLKNRGYDSAGIGTITNKNSFVINKYASVNNVDAYEKLYEDLHLHNENIIGIAHTRWATHGVKNDINSHPHISNCGKFMLVHNGIIENYKEIKSYLIDKGYTFVSETDTEVIVQLLSYIYKTTKNVVESIQQLVLKLNGTWGLAILCIDTPDKIYCIRHGSPLLVGYGDNTIIISSEKSGFLNKIQNYFVLKNNDLFIADTTTKNIPFNINKKYKIETFTEINEDISPHPYPHWTLKEIYEQYTSCQRAFCMGGRILDDTNVKLGGLEEHKDQLTKIDNLILLGCGTSYFAGQHGVEFFKELCNFNTVQIFDGAEFNEHDIPKKGTCGLLLISQSGETKDLHRCIDIGRTNNTLLIGLVNVVDSLIAREVDCGCYLNAGREVGVASTKAYSSQVVMLSMIAVWFSQQKEINESKRKQIIADLRQLPNDIQNTFINLNEKIDTLIETIFKNKRHCFLLGKGKSESVAKEGALKIKEISYIHSEGYSTSALKHGPFSLLDEEFPVIILAPKNKYLSKAENAYEEIKSRSSPILFITTDNNCCKNNDKEYVLLTSYNKTYSDLMGIFPLQLLAYKLSINNGINPDIPKNLAKVVTVE